MFVGGNVEVQYPSYVYFVKKKKALKISIKWIMTESLRPIHPSFLVKKFGVVISERQIAEISEKWDLFLKTGECQNSKEDHPLNTHYDRSETFSEEANREGKHTCIPLWGMEKIPKSSIHHEG